MNKDVNCIRWKSVLVVAFLTVVSAAVFAQSSGVVAEGPEWDVLVAEPEYDSFHQSTHRQIVLSMRDTEFAVAAFLYEQLIRPSTKGMAFGVVLSGEWYLASLWLRLDDGEVLEMPIPLKNQQHGTIGWRAVTRASTLLIAQEIIDRILSHESDVSGRVRYESALSGSYNFDFAIPWEFWSEVAAIQ